MHPLGPKIRPGTGVSSKGNERVEQILGVARDVLVSEGYHGLTMRAIAKGCGITVGNLNYYYANKTDLLRDLLDFVMDGYLEVFDTIRASAPASPMDALIKIIGFIIDDLGTRETTVFFPELWALANHDEVAAERMEDLYRREREVFEQLIEKIRPDLDQAYIRHLALYVSASIEGHTMFLGHQKPWAAQRQQAKKIAITAITDLVRNARPEHPS